nr:retrovirus-related Pol polyprotein from transposon TNT 1-94 [Tanacetum cinerariifolium]GEY00331.1 retrovirus-related Pol polyprotein from transposon TNT 1-94 [Tanacetum cinerariifolium]
MSVLLDDQMNSVINCLTAKSTWDDQILFHEGPFDVKKSRVMDLKLCYNTFKFKEGLQDSPNDKEDTKNNHEYLNDLEDEYEARALLVKSKSFIKKGTQRFSSAKATDQTECYNCGKKEVSSDDNEMVEVKVLMALAKENNAINKEGTRSGEWVKISIRKDTPSRVTINITNPPVVVTDSSATDYDLASESLVFSTPLPPLKKLDGVEPISGPKTIKSSLRSNSTFKAKTLKGVIINEPSSAPAKGNKSSSASKVNSALAGKLKSVKNKNDPPLAIVMKELNDLQLQIIKNQSSYSRNNQPQHASQNALQNKYKTQFKRSCDLCGLNNHLSKNCYKVLFCKKNERTDHKTCDHAEYISTMNMSQHLKILEQPGPKVMFGDDSTCTTEGYGSIKCIGIVFTKVSFVNGLKYNLISISQIYDVKYIVQFDEKRGTIFNSNKEVVMIALRVRDVYVLDMTSSAQESCFFTKAYENLNWIWNSILVNFCDEKRISQNFFSPYTPKQNGVAEKKIKTLIEARIPNINFLYVFGCPIFIHNHKDHLGKFDEKVDDGYLLGYSLVYKAFGVINTRRQQTKETYYITFDENPDAIKFSKPSAATSTLLKLKDISVMNIFILTSLLKVPQDRWSQDKLIDLVNIIGNPGVGMLTRARAKQLSAA